MAKDGITGTKMVLDNDGQWEGGDDGQADPNDDEISSQDSRQRIAVAFSTAKLLAERMGVLYR